MLSVLERLRAALRPGLVVEREIARGGMGMVFLARDTLLDRLVAIKVLKPELATATAAERFLREARHAAGLRHPNVVQVHLPRPRARPAGRFRGRLRPRQQCHGPDPAGSCGRHPRLHLPRAAPGSAGHRAHRPLRRRAGAVRGRDRRALAAGGGSRAGRLVRLAPPPAGAPAPGSPGRASSSAARP